MFIRSDRLFLRPAWPEDRGDLPAIDGGQCAGRAMALSARHPQFVITLPAHAGAPVVGAIDLTECDGETAIDIRIARAWRGWGYATEAGHAALHVARALGHRRLVAMAWGDCPAIGRVLDKLGFVPTGEVRLCCNAGHGCTVPVYARQLCAPRSDPAHPRTIRHAA